MNSSPKVRAPIRHLSISDGLSGASFSGSQKEKNKTMGPAANLDSVNWWIGGTIGKAIESIRFQGLKQCDDQSASKD